MSSDLLNRLMDDIKAAMKSGEKDRLTTLRMLHAQIKDATTNAGRDPTDGDVATVIGKSLKQRQDAIAQFEQAGRQDLAANELREMEWIKAYQPPQLSEPEIESLVRAVVAEVGANSRKDMGKVMGALQPRIKGRADGKLTSQIVQRILPG